MRKFYSKLIVGLLLFILSSVSVKAQTTLISATGDGGFETGTTFALNNWTVVNNATTPGR